MKTAIIGSGFVGSTTAYSLAVTGLAQELVLCDVNRTKAEAETLDILHATPNFFQCRVKSGSYKDLSGSDIIIITAGIHQKPGETRLNLFEKNIEIFKDIAKGIITYAADSLILVASNPVDLLTAYLVKETKLPTSRIIGSGTILDTARFRCVLGDYLKLSPQSIHTYVLGEHGDSEVLIWSNATVGNTALESFAEQVGISLNAEVKNHIDSEVRNSAYKIIAGKNATYYGIAANLCRICKAVSYNENAILTVSTHHQETEGVKDICLSLPTVINRDGVSRVLYPELAASEHALLRQSAEKIRDYVHF